MNSLPSRSMLRVSGEGISLAERGSSAGLLSREGGDLEERGLGLRGQSTIRRDHCVRLGVFSPGDCPCHHYLT